MSIRSYRVKPKTASMPKASNGKRLWNKTSGNRLWK